METDDTNKLLPGMDYHLTTHGHNPGYGQPPPTNQGLSPGYGQPPPNNQGLSPGYGQPPPNNQGLSPGYGQPPPYQPLPGTGQPWVNGQVAVTGQPQVILQTGAYGNNLTTFPSNVVLMTQPAPIVLRPNVRPSDFTVLSIISCFFFFPMAICALMYSDRSKKSSDRGDYLRGDSEGRIARNIATAAIIIGVLMAITIALAVVFLNAKTYYYDWY